MNVKNPMSVMVMTRTLYLLYLFAILSLPLMISFYSIPSSGPLGLMPKFVSCCHSHPLTPGYFGYSASNVPVLESGRPTYDSEKVGGGKEQNKNGRGKSNLGYTRKFNE